MSGLAGGIRAGSFRGAPFLYQASAAELGRRLARHDFPKRDRPWAEDMGRRAREFTLTVFVLGPNWQAERDALIRACEAPGAGTLVHPLFGEMRVQLASCQVSESTDRVGRADFSLGFVEAGDIAFAATVVPSQGAQAMAAAASLDAAASSSFATAFQPLSTVAWVARAAQSDLAAAMGLVGAAGQRIRGAAAAIEQAVGTAQAQTLDLLGAPLALGNTVVGLLQSVTSLTLGGAWNDLFGGAIASDAATIGGLLKGFLGLGGTTSLAPSVAAPPAAAASDPDRLRQAGNSAAALALLRAAALAEAAQAAVALPYDSAAAAAAARDTLSDALDAAILAAPDDASAAALESLRLAAVRELDGIAAKLPPLASFTPAASLAAAALAHRLYDDPAWAEDIVARNDVRHPLFVPAGLPLEILGTQ